MTYEYLFNDVWDEEWYSADEVTMKEILKHYVRNPQFVLERVDELKEVQLPKIIIRVSIIQDLDDGICRCGRSTSQDTMNDWGMCEMCEKL